MKRTQLPTSGKISLILLLIFCNLSLLAQTNPLPTPGRHLDSVTDFYGHRYSLGEIAINDTVRAASRGTFEAMIPAGCASGYFQLWLEPGCGFEGADATSVAKLNVLCQVFQDLSAFITSPLTGTGGLVNIWVRKMSAVAGGPFIGVATSFFITPTSATVSGIGDNTMWITINSGTDAYTNVASPLIPTGGAVSASSPYYHGLVAFDEGVNWHTDLSTPPGNDSIDLYTVALHEAMHALGFMTLINYDGTSRLGTDRKYYDRYDRFLKTAGGTDLITPFGGCTSMYDWQFNPLLSPWVLSPVGVGGCPAGFLTGAPTDFTNCATAIEYVDGIIINQPVYTPECYEPGSSLSHFEDECYVPGSFSLAPPASDNHYFVMSNAVLPGPYVALTYPGPMKRFPQPEERQVLCDIGYRVGNVFGNAVNLNDHTYVGGDCGADPVVGINDGILPGGAYTFMTLPGVPVDINWGTWGDSLISNDYSADGFKCLEVVFGSGVLSGTTGGGMTTISFTPSLATFGVQLLRYIPFNSTTGVEGNITYVYVYVGDPACGSACDLVPNGGFENVAAGLSYGFLSGNMRCWDDYCVSPDIFERAATALSNDIPNSLFFAPPSDVHFPGTLLAAPNDHFIGFQSLWSNDWGVALINEAAQTGLTTPLTPGQTYFISCWAKLANHNSSIPPFTMPTHMQFGVDPAPPPVPSVLLATGFPLTVTTIWDFELTKPDDNWHYFSHTFNYVGPVGNALVVAPAPWLNPVAGYPGYYQQYLVIDDISIKTAATLSDFMLPDTICVADGTIDLTTLVTVPGGEFSWPEDVGGATNISHADLFDPITSFPTSVGFDGLSRVTICYDYLDILGCTQRICKEVLIIPIPDPIAGAHEVCVGDSIVLTDATVLGSWVSGDDLIATVGPATGLVHGISAGVVVISYGSPTACFAMHTVTVNPLPAPITGMHTICSGGSMLALDDASAGGIWSCSPPGIATIDAGTGVLTSVGPGTATITYTLPTGCLITTTLTVSSGPSLAEIEGNDTVCIGDTIWLSNSFPGGVWASDDPGLATIDATTGILTGVSAGVVLISYLATDSCGSSFVTEKIAVSGPPVLPPITGIFGVCSGDTTVLYNTVPGGVWVGGPAGIATIDPVTGVVTGVASGTATFSYSVTTMCGTTVESVNVRVNMPPYITTNYIVACQSLTHPSDAYDYYIVSDASECIKVCENTVVRYYANAVAGSAFTWTVTGGTVITDYGDSIDVLWPVAGTIGSIKLEAAFSHCNGEAIGCIRVIEKPRAKFVASATSICLDDNIVFTNLSVAPASSPIVYTFWDFGDGGTSSVVHPEHTFTTSGTFFVKLVVRNACNCTDTFKMKISVDKNPGPDIKCPSVVCENEYATYTTKNVDPCHYNWTVEGGTIFYGAGTDSIIVVWDAVGEDGFGYVSLSESCTRCTKPTTIKVPVVMANPTIKGPATICAGVEYEYKIPLWPGTEYRWGVLDSPAAIIYGTNKDHKVIVKFDEPGTYTLHCWYQNRLKLCGGNVFLEIEVIAPTTISGNTTVCFGSSEVFSLGSGFTGDWELADVSGSVLVSTPSSGTFPASLIPAPGIYILTATGNFCADPIVITVSDGPAAVDDITGKSIVCPNRPYTYKASTDVPGTVYQWEAIGGTVSPASGSGTVTAVWSPGVVKYLIARHVSISPPYCQGVADTLEVFDELINPDVTGEVVPCANSYHHYTANYTSGEVYDWQVIPNTAGSVTAGDHTPDITILWNNVPTVTPTAIIAKIVKCDSEYTDTLFVAVQPAPAMAAWVSFDTICPGQVMEFYATSGAAYYAWDFGDGSPVFYGGDTVLHTFPNNTSIDNIIYTVRVTPMPGSSAICPPSGIGIVNMVVLPGPLAYITASTFSTCADSTPVLLVGSVTSNVGALYYQWYENGVLIPGATDATFTALDTGTYHYTIIADNYCSAASVPRTIGHACPVSSGCGTITATTSNSCNTVTLIGDTPPGATGLHWEFHNIPIPGGAVTSFSWDIPGIYEFTYYATYDACHTLVRKKDTIGVVPQFRYEVQCANGGMDSIFLADYTVYLPFYTIDSVKWADGSGYIGIGPNLHIARPAPGSYTFTMYVFCTRPGGGTFVCNISHTMDLPDPPVASFVPTPGFMCQGVPITFVPLSSPALLLYSWNFGDSAYSLIESPERAYNWVGPGDPNNYFVTLTVTDTLGCTDDTTVTVDIYQNRLEALPMLDQTVCSPYAPVSLSYIPIGGTPVPISHLWSTGDVTAILNVTESGAYWVTVKDVFQCQITRPRPDALKVRIINTPVPQITGRRKYCVGETVELSGFAGTGVTYKWLRNGSLLSDTTYAISHSGLAPDLYQYRLIITVADTSLPGGCPDTSDVYSVYVYALPPAPAIAGPDLVSCDPYGIRFTATASSTGTFNWSNGVYGAVNETPTGGPFKVWFTDLNGCTSSAVTHGPVSPETYFPYFPTGCYDLCKQLLPVTLFGPPSVYFDTWAWLNGGTPVSAGITSYMYPYTITGAGSYQWELGNGLCTRTSPPMDVSETDCDKCPQIFLSASLACDSANPKSYNMTIMFNNPGTAFYTMGTDIGPIVPFTGVLTAGSYTLNPTFTTLYYTPLPDSVTVQLQFTFLDGTRCFASVKVPVPGCAWVDERPLAPQADTVKQNDHHAAQTIISSAMLVFPNPATNTINISYRYGTDMYKQKNLAVYDVLGRRMEGTMPQDEDGTWTVDVSKWAAGMYIVRMEADGTTLHTRRVVINAN